MSSRWSRDELEDKYLRLYAENQELREYKTKQQEKIKMYYLDSSLFKYLLCLDNRLTTKLERLYQDKKKLLSGEGIDISSASQNVPELQERVMSLNVQNEKLKAKVKILCLTFLSTVLNFCLGGCVDKSIEE